MKGFQITCSPGSLILSGELDLDAAPDIIAAGTAALNGTGPPKLDIDLAAVTFIDSTAIGAFIGLNNDARAAGGHLNLINVPQRVRRILQIVGLEAVFGLVSSA